MKDKITELERKLTSVTEWKSSTESWIIDHFIFLGFKCPKDFLKVRFFDFLNLDCVDNNRAEEMITALSDFLFPGREDFLDYEQHLAEKRYIGKWIKEHKKTISNIRLEDLICDQFLSKQGILTIFDGITQSFYRSNEYDSRRYKYSFLKEIPEKQRT